MKSKNRFLGFIALIVGFILAKLEIELIKQHKDCKVEEVVKKA